MPGRDDRGDQRGKDRCEHTIVVEQDDQHLALGERADQVCCLARALGGRGGTPVEAGDEDPTPILIDVRHEL